MENIRLKKSLTKRVDDIRNFLDDHLMNDNDTYQEASVKSYMYDSLNHLQKQVNDLIRDRG